MLVDADTQANASEWLAGGGGMLASVGDGGRGVYRLFIDGEEPAPLSVKPYLDLLPAGARTQSLASELDRMLTMSLDQKRQGLSLVRELLHDATSAYEQVWIDTPPSLQSPSLIESFLAAADFVVVPFRASPDHARAAYKVIEQLVALDELGVEHATPLGVVIFDRDATATRLEASVRQELDRISQYVPLFTESVIHRAAPAAAALRMHMTPHELLDAAPSNSERLARLREGRSAELPSIATRDGREVHGELRGRVRRVPRAGRHVRPCLTTRCGASRTSYGPRAPSGHPTTRRRCSARADGAGAERTHDHPAAVIVAPDPPLASPEPRPSTAPTHPLLGREAPPDRRRRWHRRLHATATTSPSGTADEAPTPRRKTSVTLPPIVRDRIADAYHQGRWTLLALLELAGDRLSTGGSAGPTSRRP